MIQSNRKAPNGQRRKRKVKITVPRGTLQKRPAVEPEAKAKPDTEPKSKPRETAAEWTARIIAAKRAQRRAALQPRPQDRGPERYETAVEVENAMQSKADCPIGSRTGRFARVAVPVWITRIAPSGNAAIVLGQLWFWDGRKRDNYQPMSSKIVNHKRWWVSGYDQIAARTGLTSDKVRRAIRQLAATGLIERCTLADPHKRAPTSHLRPHYDNILRAWLRAYPANLDNDE